MFRVSGHYDHVLYYSKEVTELMFRVSGHYDRVLDWSEEVYGTDVQGLWALWPCFVLVFLFSLHAEVTVVDRMLKSTY